MHVCHLTGTPSKTSNSMGSSTSCLVPCPVYSLLPQENNWPRSVNTHMCTLPNTPHTTGTTSQHYTTPHHSTAP